MGDSYDDYCADIDSGELMSRQFCLVCTMPKYDHEIICKKCDDELEHAKQQSEMAARAYKEGGR